MVSTNTLVESRNGNRSLGPVVKGIFRDNWDQEFIVDGLSGRKLKYKEFFAAAMNCSKWLGSLGIGKGDTVCVLLRNCLDHIVLYFAALISGAVISPIDPLKTEREIRDILSQLTYKLMIVDEGATYDGAVSLSGMGDVYREGDRAIHELDVFMEVDYSDLYLITFTSGSTGIPKGVMHSAGNLMLTAIRFAERFEFDRRNVFLHNLPMSYMSGILNQIFLPFVCGGRIVVGERFSVTSVMRFWDIPIRYSVNTLWIIPTILRMLLKLDRGAEGREYAKANEIIACVGTAPLDDPTKAAFEKEYNIKVYESYGLSETLFNTTNYPMAARKDSVGKPLKDVKITFSQDGEAAIKVPWMFLGYLRAENNLEAGRFRSGDIGEMDKDGYIFITGRKKDLIIKGGVNISPKRIEDQLSNMLGETAVIGIKEDEKEESVV
jgi:long-chain acyl-CoA synthetase